MKRWINKKDQITVEVNPEVKFFNNLIKKKKIEIWKLYGKIIEDVFWLIAAIVVLWFVIKVMIFAVQNSHLTDTQIMLRCFGWC